MSSRASLLFLLLVCPLACTVHRTRPPAPRAAPLAPAPLAAQPLSPAPLAPMAPSAGFDPARFTLDGLTLGAPIDAWESKYASTLCDADPLDHKTRHLFAHFPAPCRQAAPLPDRTFVAVYTIAKKQPPLTVLAVAWMFGDWPFAARAFPASVRGSWADAERALGPSTKLFDYEARRGGGGIEVRKHRAGVYSMVRSGKPIGFAVGDMTETLEGESWSGLLGNALRYEK